MKRTAQKWISLLLSVLLVCSVVSGMAEGMDEVQDWVEQGKAACREADYETGFQYFQKAADLGNAKGLFFIGALYMQGYGVEQSYEKALEYLQKALKLNPQ